MLVIFTFFFQNPYSGTWTRTRELPVLVYVLKSPRTGHTKNPPIFGLFCNKFLNSHFYINHWCLAILPCLMGHRIRIWAQKNWFYPEIVGREVGPISVTHTVYSGFNTQNPNLVPGLVGACQWKPYSGAATSACPCTRWGCSQISHLSRLGSFKRETAKMNF